MTEEPRHRRTNETLSKSLSQYSAELDIDAIGMWHIVPRGQYNFGLEGKALANYVRQVIGAILDAGGIPVRHEPGSGYEWVWQKQYGTTRDEIAEAIVREWEPVPNDSYSMIEHCPWFARPDPDFPNYVKMD
jgi:hypothetical protein